MRREFSGRWLLPIARPFARAGRWLWYRYRLARGEAAGAVTYVWSEWRPPDGWALEVRLPAAAATPAAAARWCRRQTLRELRAVGYDADGEVRWRADRNGPVADRAGVVAAPWFCGPGELADIDPAHLEASLLVLAAEDIDAVVLRDGGPERSGGGPESAAAVAGRDHRRLALFSAAAWSYDPAADEVRPRRDDLLVKAIGAEGADGSPRSPAAFHRHRRGPYL